MIHKLFCASLAVTTIPGLAPHSASLSLSADGTSSDRTNGLADTMRRASPSAFGDGTCSLWAGLSEPALLSNNSLLHALTDAADFLV